MIKITKGPDWCTENPAIRILLHTNAWLEPETGLFFVLLLPYLRLVGLEQAVEQGAHNSTIEHAVKRTGGDETGAVAAPEMVIYITRHCAEDEPRQIPFPTLYVLLHAILKLRVFMILLMLAKTFSTYFPCTSSNSTS